MPHHFAQHLQRLRSHFNSNRTRSFSYRQQQLKGIRKFLKEKETDIENALFEDLGRPAVETFITEIAIVWAELNYTYKHLAAWMKRKRVSTSLVAQPGKSFIYKEPRGVVLIIAPWNYPLQLCLLPLIGAIAAGNCVVIKPSETAPAMSALLANYLSHYLDNECIQVIEGGVSETTALLNEKFDYIFYTGSASIGKKVMAAAAKQLTPLTLELGGKSPCVVDKDSDLNMAAKRIVWGKFSNAGQTCVAPDYILVHKTVENDLLHCLKQYLYHFYGEDPEKSPDYGRIINPSHCQRLKKLLEKSGEIYVGGNINEKECYAAPTILQNVFLDAPIMQEEIFGPLLPVISVANMDEAITFINAKPKPLSLYLFTKNKEIEKKFIEGTQSGNMCINHLLLQLAIPALPFGGAGESGFGAYHGKASFDTFSHQKSVLMKSKMAFSFLYPPYKAYLKKWLRLFLLLRVF